MFERFTRDARAVVVTSIDLCTTLDADEVRPVHLLLALTEEGNGARDLLAAHGVTQDAVGAALGAPRATPPVPLGDDDAAALRSLGIDLDAIREAVDSQFGEGALDGASAAASERAEPDDPHADLDEPTSAVAASGWAVASVRARRQEGARAVAARGHPGALPRDPQRAHRPGRAAHRRRGGADAARLARRRRRRPARRPRRPRSPHRLTAGSRPGERGSSPGIAPATAW